MQYKSFYLSKTGDPICFDSLNYIANSQLLFSRPWRIVFRSGRALDSQSLKDRDAVLKQLFSSKIANVRLYLFPEAWRFLYFFDVIIRFKAKQMLQMQISLLPLQIYQAYCPLSSSFMSFISHVTCLHFSYDFPDARVQLQQVNDFGNKIFWIYRSNVLKPFVLPRFYSPTPHHSSTLSSGDHRSRILPQWCITGAIGCSFYVYITYITDSFIFCSIAVFLKKRS